MRRYSVFIATMLSLHCFAQSSSPDAGQVYQGNSGKAVIEIPNPGDEPLRILKISPASEGDRVGEYSQTVSPKSVTYIPVEVYNAAGVGDLYHSFRVETDAKQKPSTATFAHLFGLSVLDDASPAVDLGTVDLAAAPQPKTVTLSSHEVPGFKLTKIIESPDFATAKILPDGVTVEVTAKRIADWGRHSAALKVGIDSEVQKIAWIRVTADVHGDIIPSRNPIDLDVIKNGEITPEIVQLKSRDGRKVRVGEISVSNMKASAIKGPCLGSATGCAQIELRLADDQPSGQVHGLLLVDLPDFHRQLPIEVTGLFFGKQTKIHMLDDEAQKAKEQAALEGTTSRQTPQINLQQELRRKTALAASASSAALPGRGPVLRWKVSHDNAVYGYLIYRADAEAGPFLRVNKQIIRRIEEEDGADAAPIDYAWRDESAESGKTYWYYIGIINTDGTKKNLNDPQKVVAK